MHSSDACWRASRIVLIPSPQLQLDVQSEQVDLRTHLTQSGADFYTINPKGNVPALILDDGTILNENAATLQWIADQVCRVLCLPGQRGSSLPSITDP